MINHKKIIKELKKHKNSKKAEILSRFFKTGKGEYGEGDVFWGINVPTQRKIAKKHKTLPLKEIEKLLNSKVHEMRLTGLLILVHQFQINETDREKIYNFYLKNLKTVNNWDLVDLSAPKIVGAYLLDKDKHHLYKQAKSDNLWEKRVSIVSTYAFIKKGQLSPTYKIAKMLISDKHDLIHKAVGWMLREAGKKDQELLEKFLNQNIKKMPRTMLRYAIEKFDARKRKHYLSK